jgi:hypothetical protein
MILKMSFILYSIVKHFKILEIIWLSHIIGKNLQCINLYNYQVQATLESYVNLHIFYLDPLNLEMT